MNSPFSLLLFIFLPHVLAVQFLRFSSRKVLEQVLNFKHMLKCFSLLNPYSWLPLGTAEKGDKCMEVSVM